MTALCPDCGHADINHALEQFWPEGTCADCRSEMSPFHFNPPRPAAEVCKLTSRDLDELSKEGTP